MFLVKVFFAFGLVLSAPWTLLVAAKIEKLADYEYSLTRYLKKKNVILVFATQPKASDFITQRDVFKEQYKWLRDREVVLYYVFEDESGRADDLILRPVDSQSLRKKFNVSKNQFRIFVLNKSGAQILTETHPQTLEAFDKILKK